MSLESESRVIFENKMVFDFIIIGIVNAIHINPCAKGNS